MDACAAGIGSMLRSMQRQRACAARFRKGATTRHRHRRAKQRQGDDGRGRADGVSATAQSTLSRAGTPPASASEGAVEECTESMGTS
eukprot:6986901-Lingulodinium_polyedra.AAC.1